MREVLVYLGAGSVFLWGVGHVIPTRSIVRDFGALTNDNRKIITMEWVAEGLTLCFVAALFVAAAGMG